LRRNVCRRGLTAGGDVHGDGHETKSVDAALEKIELLRLGVKGANDVAHLASRLCDRKFKDLGVLLDGGSFGFFRKVVCFPFVSARAQGNIAPHGSWQRSND
jgi:hypothetical protein